MRGGSTGKRGHSGDRKGGGSRHIRDETDTAGTSPLTRHRPVHSTTPVTQHGRPASTRLEHNSLGIQDDRKGDDSTSPESHADSDSAGDMEPRRPARARIYQEISSDGGSSFSPDADLSDGSSGLEDEPPECEDGEGPQDESAGSDEGEGDSLLAASDDTRMGSTEDHSPGARGDGASEPPPGRTTDDAVGRQSHLDTDIYSSGSGMRLVVVDCFEELFDPDLDLIDAAREIKDAIETGMNSRWGFLEAARTHRALNKCMNLAPGTVLYERLFMRLASALVKAFQVGGTPEQQKSVFLMEATASFEVRVEKTTPMYIFDNLILTPGLFHADLLITKLIHVSFPQSQLQPTGTGSC